MEGGVQGAVADVIGQTLHMYCESQGIQIPDHATATGPAEPSNAAPTYASYEIKNASLKDDRSENERINRALSGYAAIAKQHHIKMTTAVRQPNSILISYDNTQNNRVTPEDIRGFREDVLTATVQEKPLHVTAKSIFR